MKKFLAVLMCLQLSGLAVFAEYDFSDEAQAEFDRQKEFQYQSVDFSKKKTDKEIKSDNIQPDFQDESRTDYEPSPLLYEPTQELYKRTSDPKRLHGTVVTVPAGTSFDVTFVSGINSGSLEKSDRLTVQLTNDLIYNGQLIAPTGSLVYGSATDAQNAGYAYGSGALEIDFTEILAPDGTLIPISTEKIYLEAKSERAQKMTRDVVIGAIGSMLVGAVFTALGGSDDWGRNMAVYGGIGALGGGLHGVMQRGKDVDIPDGTTVRVKLTAPLTATQYEP